MKIKNYGRNKNYEHWKPIGRERRMEEVSREKQNHQENEENKNLTSSSRDDYISCFQDLSFSFSCHYSLLY